MAKAVVLYGLETLVLLVAMEKKIERAHSNFLRQITGKQARRIVEGTWETPGARVVRETGVTNTSMTYIGRQQATMDQWLELQLIFEMCAGEKVWEGVGLRSDAWRHQVVIEKQL